MDVTKISLLLVLSLFLVHCAPEKKHGFVEATSFCQTQASNTQFVVHWRSGEFSVVQAKSKKDFIENFLAQHSDEVEWAEHDFLLSVPMQSSDSGPVDPEWGTDRIQAPRLWEKGIYGEGVIVAIIDTGVDINHIKLAPNIYRNPAEVKDGLDNDGNGYVDDINGYNFVENTGEMFDDRQHGTHVAGIVAATHGIGFSKGVAPKSKILPLRTMDVTGYGPASNAALAIKYAVSKGAKVINASWGSSNCSITLYNAIRDLAGQDVLFMAAAGNSTGSLDRYSIFPAVFDFSHQITVGASAPTDLMAAYSNYSRTKVHLLAPGMLWSTMPNDYESVQFGTSMATPMVSGAAALLKSALPHVSMLEIRQALLDGVDAPPQINGVSSPYPVITGGRLNVWNSYQLLLSRLP
jgi:subtilisin family serine protease